MFARISSVAYNGKHIRFVCAMIPMADPGFPGGGTNLLFGIIFAEKLHENETIMHSSRMRTDPCLPCVVAATKCQ